MKTLKYSRQREAIKACLMGRFDHPTADALYMSIRQEFPNISLGTVYRNLNLLVDLGEIQKLTFGDGTDHFDADTTPHYHLVCRDCGSVTDLRMPVIHGLNEQAESHCGSKIEGHTIFFYGTCEECLRKAMKS